MKLWVKCDRCNGKGELKSFRHVKNGVCFRCRLDKEALVAPGDYMANVEFNGGVLRVGQHRFKLSETTKLGRKRLIEKASKLFVEMDSETKPRGFYFAELVCLARVADRDVAVRIFAALRQRARNDDEVKEISGLAALLGIRTVQPQAAV